MRLLAKARIEHSDLGGTALLAQTGKDAEVDLSQGPDGIVSLTVVIKGKLLTLPVLPPMVLYGGRTAEGHLAVKFMRVKLKPWETSSKCVQVTLSSPDTEALTKLRDGINRALQRHVSKPAAPSSRSAGGAAGVRRPLAPRSLNTLGSAGVQQQVAASIGSKAPFGSGGSGGAGSGGGASLYYGAASRPAASGCSGGSVTVTTLRPSASAASLMGSATFSVRGAAQAAASSADSRAGSRGAAGSSAGEDLAPLSGEQARALELVKSGKSIFFTGCAGTGKSLLLKHILRALPPDSTFVTGTTGLAACHLGGTTINSFAGIGRGDGDPEALARMAGRGEAMLRWRRATALILDEVSMMDGRLFDTLEFVARRVRGSDTPFGGVQLILSGDFHQLPPVAKGGRAAEAQRRFCFEAESWGRCVHACVQLTKVFRQSDQEFVDILGKVRGGACPEAVLRRLLAACRRPLDTADGILPTKLYTHREDVDRINVEQLAELPSAPVRFLAQDVGTADVLAASCPAKRELELKVGAQVMLLKNLSRRQGLVNGARGVVEAFSGSQRLPVVRFANGEVVTLGKEKWTLSAGGRIVAQRLQLPLDLGWAMSVHKSQGLTLDRVEVSLERAFEPGMAYVALSRVKSLDGLRILGGTIAPQALRADARVVAFYQRVRAAALLAVGGSP